MRMSRISLAASALVVGLLAAQSGSAQPFGGMGGHMGGPGMMGGHGAHFAAHHRGDRQAMLDRPDRIEGRIAFLKAELKISDAQTAQWDAVAKAMRDQSTALTTVRGEMRTLREAAEKEQPTTAPDALSRREKLADAHAKATAAMAQGQKQFAAAFSTLYKNLNAEQKKTADELLVHKGPRRGEGPERDRGQPGPGRR